MAAEGKKRAPHKPSHAPFHDLVVEAIAGLHERGGSSIQAIRKFVQQKYGDKLSGNWEKLLSNATKKLVEAGDLVKQKASYKLGDELKHKHAKKPAAVRRLLLLLLPLLPRPRRARARAAPLERVLSPSCRRRRHSCAAEAAGQGRRQAAQGEAGLPILGAVRGLRGRG